MLYLFFQAVPTPQEDLSSADEGPAAKRRRLSSSASPADTPMETTPPSTSTLPTAPGAAPAARLHSISRAQTSEPASQASTTPHDAPAQTSVIQMAPETPMHTADAFTDSALTSGPTLTPQTTLNSDPLLSAATPSQPSQPMCDSYTPSSGYVSYMETLLHSHFPQDDGPGPLY